MTGEPHGPAVAAVEAFPGLRVVVVGDVVADEWIVGECREVSRDGPVPTLLVHERIVQAGGAGNTAANVAALGAAAPLVGLVGDDGPGAAVGQVLAAAGVGTDGLLQVPGAPTVVKRRLVAEQQVLARFDEGAGAAVDAGADRRLAVVLAAAAADADAVVAADYGRGAAAGPAVRGVLGRLRRQGRPVVLDARDLRSWRDVPVSVVTPNWQEVSPLLGPRAAAASGPARASAVVATHEQLRTATRAEAMVVTLDVDGAVVLAPGEPPRHVPVPRAEPAHPAGAGDAFAAALALALAAGTGLAGAVDLACAAAGVVVRRPGTAVCTAADLRAGLGSPLAAPAEVLAAVAQARAKGRRVAFTNGCFDLLHPGHIHLLRSAADLAEVVVVALDSDAGVRRVKGPGRPVNGLADRAAVLAALGPVDHVVAFDDAAPLSLLRALRPDVYVKGADHDVQALPEARLVRALGGSVHVVPCLPHSSTSGVIAACAQAVG